MKWSHCMTGPVFRADVSAVHQETTLRCCRATLLSMPTLSSMPRGERSPSMPILVFSPLLTAIGTGIDTRGRIHIHSIVSRVDIHRGCVRRLGEGGTNDNTPDNGRRHPRTVRLTRFRHCHSQDHHGQHKSKKCAFHNQPPLMILSFSMRGTPEVSVAS